MPDFSRAATTSLPVFIAGCLVDTTAFAAPDMPPADIIPSNTIVMPHHFMLDGSLLLLLLAIVAAALLVSTLERWFNGPRLRVQEEID